MLSKKRVICLYGGPGCGKSTTCAGLFYRLKLMGYDCEMNREYVKDWAWENRKIAPGDQSYFFSKNARKERVYMAANLDFIITDSPLILTHFYGLKYDPFEQKFNTSLSMLKNHHSICRELGYKVDHFLLERAKRYSDAGRYQTEEEARSIDTELQHMLEREDLNIRYHKVLADENCVETIISKLEKISNE